MRPIDADFLMDKIFELRIKQASKRTKIVFDLDALEYLINKMPTLSIKEQEEALNKIKLKIIQ